ncbi:MAG: S1 family peptidase [Solirubrobacterales bacterium]
MPRPALGATLVIVALCAFTSAAAAQDPGSRIVGGGKANPVGWQFAVALEQKRRLICSGSLIAPTKVLTAAHCVKGGKRKQLSVLAGAPSISRGRRAPRIKVTAVALDPKYAGRKDRNDFAVITLANPPAAQPITLPTPQESAAATRPGMTLRSAGWGTRSAWGFRIAERLKTAKERIYRARKCQRVFSKEEFQGRSMICALGKLVGRFHSRLRFHSTSCTGDSGGPLVADTPTGPRLVGAVSAGTFPCGFGGPSIYARVSNQLGFIQRALAAP